MRQVKRFKKYTYSTVTICDQTDQVYTRCYMCGEWKPSTTEYFKKEWDSRKWVRGIRPICKKCTNEQLKEWLKNKKKQKELEELENMVKVTPETVREKPLIDKKEEKTSMEEKLDKILAYLFW